MSPLAGQARLICLEALRRGLVAPEGRHRAIALLESLTADSPDPSVLVEEGLLRSDQLDGLASELAAAAAAGISLGAETIAAAADGATARPAGADPSAPTDPSDLSEAAILPQANGASFGARYVQQAIIGHGGMGEVLLCVDRDIHRQVALKRMLESTARDPAKRARFVEEAQVSGQLEHPNIVPVYELARDPKGKVYYTMKLIRGRSLGEVLTAVKTGREAPSLIALLQVFLKVCDAIAFAHSRGVLHRDLKPANIMVGDYGEVIVVDWGLAKIIKADDRGQTAEGSGGAESGHASRVTRQDSSPEVVTDRQEIAALQTLAGSMMGTPAYMPPEQALGKLDLIDERADIYALGAILYELLTLERAIQGESQIAVILNVVKGNIVPPATRAPGRSIPREMADAAMKCLATRREDRYQAVADLRADISLFIEGREAWIPVCSMDFARDPLDPRFDVVWSEKDWPQNAHWVKGVAQATIRDGQLHVSGGPEWTTYSALHWREEVGEETRVAATLVNEPGGETTAKSIVRVCVSGDGAHGYRFVFCGAPRFDVELDTAANGYYELLCHWPGKLDPNRASWDIVVERAGPWLRATVDGVKVIEYFDPVPLSGPVHRTFGFSGQNYTLTRISAWRRRMPETASILEAGRVLLENKHFDEAARFFADQVATPRGTPLDDEAQFLHGLALEGLGALDDALAAYRRAAESTNRSLAASASLRAARILVGRSNIGAAGRAALRATQLDAGVPVPEALSAALSALLRSLDPPKTNLHDREGVAALVEAMRGHLDGRSQNIASLEPLRGIPFRSMEVQHNSICDLSPLAGMPLESLQCATNRISDLEPLRGMPLRKLWCYGNPLDDLAPLAGMPLEVLHCGNTRVCDLSPLKGMPLKDLRCYHTPVRDLSPLKGMPLTWLDLGGVLVGYLAPLSGMPLSWLSVQCAYRVADLSPLKGAPLRTLFIAGCPQVTDLTPLTEMALEQLSFTPDYIEKGLDVVRSMKSLRLIGDNSTTLMDAETFWSKYDAGEFKLLSKAVGPIRQAEDGTLTLRALDAQLHGQVMWLPAGPRTGSIHGWTNESDWLSWDFELGRGGIFEVEILYSRDFVNGGGAYAVAVGEQNLEAEVQYTQGWEFFDCFSPGVLRIPVGRHSLSLEVVRITGPCGLMGLASITLKPTGRKG